MKTDLMQSMYLLHFDIFAEKVMIEKFLSRNSWCYFGLPRSSVNLKVVWCPIRFSLPLRFELEIDNCVSNYEVYICKRKCVVYLFVTCIDLILLVIDVTKYYTVGINLILLWCVHDIEEYEHIRVKSSLFPHWSHFVRQHWK